MNDILNALENKEIIVAIIGSVGVISTGIISNWDKIFHGNSMIIENSGYRPALPETLKRNLDIT
jgi:hypothetical protein